MWGYLDHGQVIVKQASLLVNLGDLRSGRTVFKSIYCILILAYPRSTEVYKTLCSKINRET